MMAMILPSMTSSYVVAQILLLVCIMTISPSPVNHSHISHLSFTLPLRSRMFTFLSKRWTMHWKQHLPMPHRIHGTDLCYGFVRRFSVLLIALFVLLEKPRVVRVVLAISLPSVHSSASRSVRDHPLSHHKHQLTSDSPPPTHKSTQGVLKMESSPSRMLCHRTTIDGNKVHSTTLRVIMVTCS